MSRYTQEKPRNCMKNPLLPIMFFVRFLCGRPLSPGHGPIPSTRFRPRQIGGHDTYFFLSLRSFRISRSVLPTDTSILQLRSKVKISAACGEIMRYLAERVKEF